MDQIFSGLGFAEFDVTEAQVAALARPVPMEFRAEPRTNDAGEIEWVITCKVLPDDSFRLQDFVRPMADVETAIRTVDYLNSRRA